MKKKEEDISANKDLTSETIKQSSSGEDPSEITAKWHNDEDYMSHLAAIVESSDDAIVSKTLNGTIKTWNKGSEKMFGYSNREAVGKNIALIIPTEYRDEEKQIIARISNNETIAHYETLRNKKDGTLIYVSISASPLKDRADNIIGVSVIARDITIRKGSEAESIRANKELIFQNEEKGKRAAELIIANKELAFQDAEKEKRANELIIANKELAFQNKEKEKRAAELSLANIELVFQNDEKQKRADELSIANKELLYQNAEKQKRADELSIANKELAFQNNEKEKRAAELVIANVELVFQNKEKEKRASELILANNELEFKNKEKEKRAAELIIASKELAYQNKEKEKRAAELSIANIELAYQNKEKEQRTAELSVAIKELAIQNEEKIDRAAELEAVNKELESFSYSVSHDLRAPLRAINGYALILKETLEEQNNPEANRLMNNIMAGAKKMGRLIDDLLTFSRLGRKELVTITVPMDPLVKNLCEEFKREQIHRNIEFRIKPLGSAQCDAVTIKQVWTNLISNAIKYSRLKENAIIEIKSEITDNEIIYSVKDNGAGFDMRYSDKLFNVFQRLHSEKEFEGTGVGLAIVQRIILKHGGRVWAESTVNEGATFFFTLNKSIHG